MSAEADDLAKLLDVIRPLYAAVTAEQKEIAKTCFRSARRHSHRNSIEEF
ncbi:MAG: hypothetical protein JWM91_4198 [Rhodospirillales bacterium]|nr:hypothetical protein [Rhodospirillales bacterium]